MVRAQPLVPAKILKLAIQILQRVMISHVVGIARMTSGTRFKE